MRTQHKLPDGNRRGSRVISGQRAASPSAWAPLREPLFRALWIAAFASNIGTWMQNVAAAWLMTSLLLALSLSLRY
jgi:hypothetical protein